MKKVTICVLLYGDYPELASRSINSIIDNFDHSLYELRVGCNECSIETLAYVVGLSSRGLIDNIYISSKNINKSPMMRRMYKDTNTEWIWWFDDDSYVTEPDTLERWLEEVERHASEPKPPVLYGKVFFFGQHSDFDYGLDIVSWIKKQRWYRDKPVPCGVDRYEPGFNADGDDARFFFVTGGVHMVKVDFINMIGWPTSTLVKRNDDVILCCAIRQNEYAFQDFDYGVVVNQHDRRGDGEDEDTMKEQLA